MTTPNPLTLGLTIDATDRPMGPMEASLAAEGEVSLYQKNLGRQLGQEALGLYVAQGLQGDVVGEGQSLHLEAATHVMTVGCGINGIRGVR